MTSNVVIVSGRQQRDSVIHKYVCILPQTPFPSRLPHNIKQSSLRYTVGPSWLFILNVTVCTHPSQTLTIPSFLLPSSNHKLTLKACESVPVHKTVSKAHLNKKAHLLMSPPPPYGYILLSFIKLSQLVRAMVCPVVMYGCESWTIKKAEC